MEKRAQLFDICILCALYEEAEAVRHEFEDRCQQVSFQSAFTQKKKYPYWYATLKNLREEVLTVLVMAMPFTGPVETPIFVQSLLDEFRPRFIAMTGICAGDRKVAIGDLVVASYAFHHDAGKIETGKEGQDLLRPEWRTTGPQSHIIMYAQALTTWKRPLIEMKQRLLGRDLLPEEHPRCLVAPMASGMAVQGKDPFPRLQEHNRKVEFLDQEVAAFYRTLQELPEAHFLAVKSICDNGDPAKNDHYHTYAARASAVYLLYFIQEYVNEETMPRRNAPPALGRAGTRQAIVKAKSTSIALPNTPQGLYDDIVKRSPSIYDPLSDNSQGNHWYEGSHSDRDFRFSEGGYHINMAPITTTITGRCAFARENFHDYLSQVQMTIVKGDGGGALLIRANGEGKHGWGYQLQLCQSHFAFLSGSLFLKRPTPRASLNQTYLLAVMARGDTFSVFIDHQWLGDAIDSTVPSGSVGLAVFGGTQMTEVVYHHLQIWRL